jgi:hypothetical protein
MATATPNILINSISGRIGNVVFYCRYGKQCVRVHVIPRNPDTEAQRIVRRAFGDAVRAWQSLSPDEQYDYTRKSRHLNMSGYNLYISIYLKRIMHAYSPAPIQELKSETGSPTWNLELLTLNHNRFPSVSESYMLRYSMNTASDCPEPAPG